MKIVFFVVPFFLFDVLSAVSSKTYLLWFKLMFILYEYLKAIARCGNEHSEWRPAEAALYCIRAISGYVSVVEAEVLPQV